MSNQPFIPVLSQKEISDLKYAALNLAQLAEANIRKHGELPSLVLARDMARETIRIFPDLPHPERTKLVQQYMRGARALQRAESPELDAPATV